MVFRIYTERKTEFAAEAKALYNEIKNIMNIASVESIRILNRYDVEDIELNDFEKCKYIVFAEPQTDVVMSKIPQTNDHILAVEFLPGQFDQRADSCEQCIQFVTAKERPIVKTAKIYLLAGNISADELDRIKKYIINPVESREASLEEKETLKIDYPVPEDVKVIEGFILMNDTEAESLINSYSLAMDIDDILFCREYFRKENRNPTVTELKMIDTYWSDHCRHTTFNTSLIDINIKDKMVKEAFDRYLKLREQLNIKKKITLMDLATIGGKYLKKSGKLTKLDESDEINACTVKTSIKIDGKDEEWLFLFKNETHNHPTEIEPFGGAATCIGGAIRDPLSGRGYVYQAMRVTGAADPTLPIEKTLKGKLPQRKIVTTAANGYSSYGNQIGLATGLVDEIYHPGYAAKRMEIGAVVGAVPLKNVRREQPLPGDIIILLGGRTGRDGCGGATGSSKSHDLSSLENCGAEVQKGNAPEERKLQRLFRNKKATRLIKKCNDFGAGGVSVAIGELADGLIIDLDKIPKKYNGLDGTELAISESQERMAVVIENKDYDEFLYYAAKENLEASKVAVVTDTNRLVMNWRGKVITDLDRNFLNSNGAEKKANIEVNEFKENIKEKINLQDDFYKMCSDLNVASKQGLSERFDSTVGAASVLMPFGGKYQLTPTQVMAAKFPVENGFTDACSVFSYGYNPFISENNQYLGAYLAVIESVSKIIASGSNLNECYLTFQEYFEKLRNDPKRWGKPFASLLGALDAQVDLNIASIGGKDSMSGSFENIDVPPTLVSFAAAISDAKNIISPEFKKAGSYIYIASPTYDKYGKPEISSLLEIFNLINQAIASKKIISAYTCTYKGIAEGLFKMSIGNKIGAVVCEIDDVFDYKYGTFILEANEKLNFATEIGVTTEEFELLIGNNKIDLNKCLDEFNSALNDIFPRKAENNSLKTENISFERKNKSAAIIKKNNVKILIPAFPGTNCEVDTKRAFEKAGGEAEILVIKNLNSRNLMDSIDEFCKIAKTSQIIFVPGGFSGGDEPDGSGKFINAFFRNEKVKDAIRELLKNNDGLMGGICNGFQALIKLGLVPYGEIFETDENSPTLTYNTISRHISKIVRTRICSNNSPWLHNTNVGDIFNVPVSHGEGRFICTEEMYNTLKQNGQIATQYVDLEGNATMDSEFNVNGSYYAIEGITSVDGRVFGRMGHPERYQENLYKNIPGDFNENIFLSAVSYFK
ncbi:phosphoribosylformylglycinamidine synthase [Eubacteriales bacterium OttesenSCG-928-G02]|nr:phosphoribosylformylglycinamidine synthase [Eubacteriales bacterium OttesenSCG-928-G02]